MTDTGWTSTLSPFIDGFYDVRSELVDHVYRRTDRHLDAADQAIRNLKTPEDVRRRQHQIRQWTREAVGGLLDSSAPLEPQSCGSIDRQRYTIERIVFQSIPGMYVTANLYRPVDYPSPRPAVLFLCGHSEPGKAEPDYQRVCAWLASSGFVVLILDPIGQGERKSYLDAEGNELVAWGIDEHSYAGMQCWWLGTSVARYFINDAQRGLDYLISLEDVDPHRIGITGSSGGGTQSALMMMLDDRIAAAAPGTFITSRRAYMRAGQAQDAEQILMGGTGRGITHADFLIAMAPRPVHVLAVDYDFFPVEGTVETIDLARHAFDILRSADTLSLYRSRAVHGYNEELARSAVDFFIRELSEDSRSASCTFEPVPGDELQCTSSGQVQFDFDDSRTVFDLLPIGDSPRAEASPRAERSAQGGPLEWLTEQVISPRSTMSEFFPRWLPPHEPRPGLSVRRALWRSEKDIFTHGVLHEPTERASKALTVAVFTEGTDDIDHREKWIVDRIECGESVLVIDVRGVGALASRPINNYPANAHYGTSFKLTCDLLEIGDSIAAGRVYDVLRALEFLRTDHEVDLGSRPLTIYATGAGQFYSVLAALLDEGAVEVEIEESLTDPEVLVSSRFYDFEYSLATLIPGLLAATDLRELLAPMSERIRITGGGAAARVAEATTERL